VPEQSQGVSQLDGQRIQYPLRTVPKIVLEVDQVGPSMLLASGDSFILRVDIACGKDLAAHHCPDCN
jgi:hypothetical protein